MALSLAETSLSPDERRRHPKYIEGYLHFKGKPIDYSVSNPYGSRWGTENLDGDLWNRGAIAALCEDRPGWWQTDHDGPPLFKRPHKQLQLL